VVKPVNLLSINEATEGGKRNIWNAFCKSLVVRLLVNDLNAVDRTFPALLKNYLESIDDCKIHTLQDLVDFNEKHADQELPSSN
jgi:amidase